MNVFRFLVVLMIVGLIGCDKQPEQAPTSTTPQPDTAATKAPPKRVDNSDLFKLSVAAEDVRVGDEVITSGVDGIFPKGILIGNIIDLHRPRHGVLQTARIRAAVDPGKIEEVMVLLKDNPLEKVEDLQ